MYVYVQLGTMDGWTSVQTVELHHKMGDTCFLAPHTRLTCHQRIYGGIQWDQFVRLATLTTGTLTDLTTDLVVANNNNNSSQYVTRRHIPIREVDTCILIHSRSKTYDISNKKMYFYSVIEYQPHFHSRLPRAAVF